ncbi:MAG: hypothetical protein GXX91_03865 [Verrucomicrobiaceae bacterium]|nr:hypothetical protein [Verrucomicrobiaceae bacterium]
MKKTLLFLFLLFPLAAAPAAEEVAATNAAAATGNEATASYRRHPIGRDATGATLWAWSGTPTTERSPDLPRIVLLGHPHPEDDPALPAGAEWHGLSAPLDTAAFPPEGPAFRPQNASAHAIWRWIGLTAPDVVLVPDNAEGRALAKALGEFPPAEVGRVKVVIRREADDLAPDTFLTAPSEADKDSARSEMRARVARSPEEVHRQLSAHYGDRFGGSYIDALAVIARTGDGRKERAAELAKAQLEKRPELPKGGGDIAGTLLYAAIDEPWARARVLAVANMAFDEQGNPREAMPTHNEMSDAVFMGGPILAEAGRITGKRKYFDAALTNYRFIADLCLREDGLYRHSPLDEAAWGRGNGFPALGLALILLHFPEKHEGRPVLLQAFRDHLAALAPHQDASGMWHQIVDRPDSYAEFTSTNMIAWSIAVALEHGWIEGADWEARLALAWDGVKRHIGTDGETLLNVCTGTGKQPNLEAYYQREAILGRDARGGAMALMLASEMKKRYTELKHAITYPCPSR